MSDTIKYLLTIENGRFKKLFESLNITDECFKCSYFVNNSNSQFYKCYCLGTCIARTLSVELKLYMYKYIDYFCKE